MTWQPQWDWKVEYDSTEITGDVHSVQIVRLENAISRATVTLNDRLGKTYIGTLDVLDDLKVSLKYAHEASYTAVFGGKIEDLTPTIDSTRGALCTATAYGYGRALRNTHCNENFGAESQNPTKDTPEEIWDELVASFINKSLGSADDTGYAITDTYIAAIAAPTIQFIHSPYRPCIHIVNEVCAIYQAHRAGSASVHWFVDPSKNLFINTIGAHEDSAQWPNYWGGSQAASTLEQGVDFTEYSFSKRVRSKDFANRVILCTDLRKPGYDDWCEDAATKGLWQVIQNCAITDDSTNHVVGSDCLVMTVNASTTGIMRYPSTPTPPSTPALAWDLTSFHVTQTSTENPLALKLYARRTGHSSSSAAVRLHTDAANYYWVVLYNTASSVAMMPTADTFYLINLPIYHEGTKDSAAEWVAVGSPDWADINWIDIWMINNYAGANPFLMDDLHFSGKLIREAYNSTSITANDEHQVIIKMASACDDAMKGATDTTGRAARLAYAELLTRQKQPVVGTVKTSGLVTILPGQLVHVHADKTSSGTFRVDGDFRAKRITHDISEEGFTTTLELTDDVVNTFTKSPSEVASILLQAIYSDPEAQSLKSSGIDLLTARLSVDYP